MNKSTKDTIYTYMDQYGDVNIRYENQIVKVFHYLIKCEYFDTLIKWESKNIDITQTCNTLGLNIDLLKLRELVVKHRTDTDGYITTKDTDIKYMDTIIYLIHIGIFDKSFFDDIKYNSITVKNYGFERLIKSLCVLDLSYLNVNICNSYVPWNIVEKYLDALTDKEFSCLLCGYDIRNESLYVKIHGYKVHTCEYPDGRDWFQDYCEAYTSHYFDGKKEKGYYCKKHLEQVIMEEK